MKRPRRHPPEAKTLPALDAAMRLMSRRPWSEAELRERLARRGYPAADSEAALQRLRQLGYLDDRALALDYILLRAGRKGQARVRLARELERRGVAPEIVQAAWEEAVRDHGLDEERLLRREAHRRLESIAPGDRRGLRRVYNALLRAGFDVADVRRALEPHFSLPDALDDRSGFADEEITP